MKTSQWILAAVVLAGLISIVTFAMNFLGGSGQVVVGPTVVAGRVIVVAEFNVRGREKCFPPIGVLEREDRTSGHIDFWFHNPNAETVQVGLDRKNCRCGSVEVYVLPEDRRAWLARSVAALVGVGSTGILGAVSLDPLARHRIQDGIPGRELLEKTEKTGVAPGQLGWVRLLWAERKGKQNLEAGLWFDHQLDGKTATLNLILYFQEPLRVRAVLRIRPHDDEDLRNGVRESLIVWSSTRNSLRIEATPTATRDSPANDPFEVGKAEPLSPAEVFALYKLHEGSATLSDETRGTVTCAYRVPIVLRAVAADGKTPFDIGQFRRSVKITSPDVDGDPKTVLVMGRVTGVIALVNEDEGGVNFRDFLRNRGKVAALDIECHDLEAKLAFDRKRTASFLDAELLPVSPAPAGLQVWTLKAKVLPDKVDGQFPRVNDPLYEDSAIYLTVVSPGKPLRSIRVPVQGRATER